MAQYTVREGESLLDVCYNACGSLSALSEIMTLNNLDTLTPTLTAGQVLEVPQTYDNAVVIVANERPFNSNAISTETINKLLNDLYISLSHSAFLVNANGIHIQYVVANGNFYVTEQ